MTSFFYLKIRNLIELTHDLDWFKIDVGIFSETESYFEKNVINQPN